MDEWIDCVSSFPAAIVLKLAYGYNVEPYGFDYMVDLADRAVKTIFSEASEPGKWLVDVIPFRLSFKAN